MGAKTNGAMIGLGAAVATGGAALPVMAIGMGIGALFGGRNKNKKFAKKAMQDPAVQAFVAQKYPQAGPILAKLASGGKLSQQEKALVGQIREDFDKTQKAVK